MRITILHNRRIILNDGISLPKLKNKFLELNGNRGMKRIVLIIMSVLLAQNILGQEFSSFYIDFMRILDNTIHDGISREIVVPAKVFILKLGTKDSG